MMLFFPTFSSVICLISALSFHEMTTQSPHAVNVAVPRNSRLPSLEYPPVQGHRFSEEAFESGIDEHQIDGVRVKIYNPEKTIVDCFKFRNKIGMDVVLEALKIFRANGNFDIRKMLKYAKICRVEKAIKPYLEAMF